MIVGILGFLLLSAIVERLAFKQLPPTQRAWAVCGTAWIVAAVIGFFILPPDEAAMGAALSAFTGLAVLLWYRSRYQSQWIDE